MEIILSTTSVCNRCFAPGISLIHFLWTVLSLSLEKAKYVSTYIFQWIKSEREEEIVINIINDRSELAWTKC